MQKLKQGILQQLQNYLILVHLSLLFLIQQIVTKC